MWWHSSVPSKLHSLHDSGYQIVILSNQAGISLKLNSKFAKSDMKSLSNFKVKASKVLTSLDLPISLYAATEKDLYRKPRAGMWRELLDNYRLDTGAVDLENCVFVGDAAGRAERKKGGVLLKKDHSCSDRYVVPIVLGS
jgi:bifunctional polynucleotide phosphatase/kinase